MITLLRHINYKLWTDPSSVRFLNRIMFASSGIDALLMIVTLATGTRKGTNAAIYRRLATTILHVVPGLLRAMSLFLLVSVLIFVQLLI